MSSGDHNEFDPDIRRGDFGIAVIVYEKLTQLLVQSPGIVSDCQITVVDEVQLIRDKGRGPLLELLLTRVKRLKPSPQIVCLSATVGHLGGFDSWLLAKPIETKNRPVPLWEGVIDNAESVTLHDVAGNRTETGNWGVLKFGENKETILKNIVRKLVAGEQMLVFRTRVDDTESTAVQLAEALDVQPVSRNVRDRIRMLEDTPMRAFLDKYIERRVAYHNAGLSLEERRLVEDFFREGVLKIVVTTATLAAGVNLPADKVVIADFRRWNQDLRTRVPIDVAEYKNCAGRAGRYGKRKSGTCLIVAEQAGQTRILTEQYIFGSPAKLESAIPRQHDMAQHILGVIAQQLAYTRSEIIELYRDSFAFVSYSDWAGDESKMINAFELGIERLLTLGLIEEHKGKLKVTALGTVAARSGVRIDTFGTLEKLVSETPLETLSDADILAKISDVAEMQSLRPFSPDQRAELLAKWIAGEPVMSLAAAYGTEYSVGHGRIRDLGEVAEWLLSTAAQAASTLGTSASTGERLNRLAQEAHFGVPTELVELARLRVLLRSDLLRLVFNTKGVRITEPHEILDTEPKTFSGILSPQKVTALKERIARCIGETLQRRKVGHLIRCDRLAAIRPLVQRVYDAKGTDFDRALEDLLNGPMVELGVHRFTRQPSGQPDLELQGANGTVVVSAAASQDDQKPVPWNKCREVLGSIRYSGTPSNFVVIGKPDFHKVAADNASELASKGTHLLLVPLVFRRITAPMALRCQ